MVGPLRLGYKDLTFIAMALERFIAWHEAELRRDDLSEDDRSDLTNDLYYLHELLGDVRREREAA